MAAGPDPDSAVAEWTVGDQVLPVELRVGPDGALRSVSMRRWANPNGRPWAAYPCGGSLDDERDFGGITLPTRLRAGYFYGTDEWAEGEFFRATITDATFRCPRRTAVVQPESFTVGCRRCCSPDRIDRHHTRSASVPSGARRSSRGPGADPGR